MSAGRLLRELEDLAADLAVDVRFEDLESAGGLCRYGGRTCLLVNQRLSVLERVALMASELASLPLGEIFTRPQLRGATTVGTTALSASTTRSSR